MSERPNGSLRRLRVATGAVLAALLVFMIAADILGFNPDYDVEPLVLGTLTGALLLILGIEIGGNWPGLGGRRD